MESLAVSYVDIQHDTPDVLDDVEQGIVAKEDIWISGYKAGSSSVHGKVRIEAQEGGGSSLTSRDGVQLVRISKTTFEVDVPELGIEKRTIKFPRQIINPPYKKAKPTSAPLHINSIAYSEQSQQLVVGGPDGFCAVLPANASATGGTGIELKGHVGDVLDCRWFPSGQVILTASSDLSIRIFAAKDGLNPRTLKGHTRAITSTHIIGVGKEVLSAGKDGTIRLWNVGEGKETRQWKVEGKRAIERMIVLEEEDALASLGLEGEGRVILAASKDGITIVPWSKPAWSVASPPEVGHLLSIAHSSINGLVATGHSDGVTILRPVSSLVQDTVQVSLKFIRRNQSPIYSLLFSSTTSDLFMGTAAGMPCRLGVDYDGGEISVSVKEEFAGWEAVGVECWAEGNGNVWCAGGEGGIRRY